MSDKSSMEPKPSRRLAEICADSTTRYSPWRLSRTVQTSTEVDALANTVGVWYDNLRAARNQNVTLALCRVSDYMNIKFPPRAELRKYVWNPRSRTRFSSSIRGVLATDVGISLAPTLGGLPLLGKHCKHVLALCSCFGPFSKRLCTRRAVPHPLPSPATVHPQLSETDRRWS